MSNSNGATARTAGNFSNNNLDTFDPTKHYIGVRLQQGVPLLDRDWNELEDTRRYFERMLRKYYIGDGVPSGVDGFKIDAPPDGTPGDFLIRAGRCLVDGYDVVNEADLQYSTQGQPLIPVSATQTQYVVYLEVWVDSVTDADDPALRNSQDINLETCIRDKLEWTVKSAVWPLQPGPRSSYVLASIAMPANATTVTADMITDLRRLKLTLADAVDLGANLQPRVQTMESAVSEIQSTLATINQQLERLFWDVQMEASSTGAIFGDTVTVTATVSTSSGPVTGVRVEFSTDYGNISPSNAVTDQNGQATARLLGIEAERMPDTNDVPLMSSLVRKVSTAIRPDTSINYSGITFVPEELGVISKYSPAATFVDTERDLGTILPIPPSRTATVSCYAKQGDGTIVRGLGSIQISYSQWVRDWLRTKIVDTIGQVDVGSRVGARFGQHWDPINKVLQPGPLQTDLTSDYADIAAETQNKLINNVFDDIPAPEEMALTGIAGHVIAQGVTNQLGVQANKAIKNQMDGLQAQGLDSATAVGYQRAIMQTANQGQAAMAQGQRVAFSGGFAF